jgi:hypothetical protein
MALISALHPSFLAEVWSGSNCVIELRERRGGFTPVTGPDRR